MTATDQTASTDTPPDLAVNYVFPVEVVVVGGLTEEDHQAIEQRIWTSFSEALARSV